MMDVVEDMMYSNVLAGNFEATYKRYIRISRMMIEHQDILRLPVKVSEDPTATVPLGDTHFHEPNLYVSSQEQNFLRNQSTSALVINDHKTVPFHTRPCSRQIRELVDKLHAGHLR